MLSRDGARLQVFLDLQRHGPRRGPEELVILDEHTIERPWGWVFFFTTRGCRDGDLTYAVGGNAPYMVNRDGSIRLAGTGRPIEDYIREYESELERQSGAWELVISEPSPCSTTAAKSIRAALGLSIAEVGAIRHRLPGLVSAGAYADLEPLYGRLVDAGIRAEIRKAKVNEAEQDAAPDRGGG
ncbi:hypothetical protein Plim_0349 [Planctopirus limnophila DSM 3776]|uniref:Uncharacterized protein n=1 Tax=Planctopirus limnophila (strain ATCC 43296 / DSM 3776 / IFAM 1008 / Mu 290) TaxID=521674 RepID=D5SPH0_PLAL2|nr:hypothetical protein Plim_0349 [Planctopirus limnophila DSM 3776]